MTEKSDMSKGKTENREIVITTNSRITFAALAMLASPLIAGLILYLKIETMQADLRSAWSINQQIVWSERLGAKNPTIIVPPIQDVLSLVSKNQTEKVQERRP